MAITLGSNIASLMAQRRLFDTTNTLSTVFERLASGQRINRASDDPAGLAVAEGLKTDARLTNQAIRNVNDGISVASVAEAALEELVQITNRQLELAEQAANGVYTLEQRKVLDLEANALVEEYNRIVASTEFNDIQLFQPSAQNFNIQAGINSSSNSSISFGVTDGVERTVGDGTFGAQLSLTDGSATTASVAVGDLNGDGFDDIVSNSANSNLTIQFSDGQGGFSYSAFATGMSTVTDVEIGDLNNDGNLDLLIGQSANLQVLIGDGTGSFSASAVFSRGIANGDSTLADLDGDGNLDLLMINESTSSDISIRYGNGDGTFSNDFTFSAGFSQYGQQVKVADLNNDGVNELIATGYNPGSNPVEIYWGAGAGTFNDVTSLSIITDLTYISDLELVDFDRDGDLDLAVVGNQSSATLRAVTLENQGDGTFDVSQTFVIGTGGAVNAYIDAADVNGDGEIDFVYGNRDIGSLVNDGEGNFTELESFQVVGGSSLGDLDTGDFDGDGAIDVAYRWFGSDLRVHFGNAQEVTSMASVYLLTEEGAKEALETLGDQLDRLTTGRAQIGAAVSRLSYANNYLYSASENLRAAESRIRDVDIAQETADLVRLTILQQATAALLAQANQQPALALSLLDSGS